MRLFQVLPVALALFLGISPAAAIEGPRETLVAARARAEDATFRNDAKGLRQAVADFERLTSDPEVGPFASYYASWAEWGLAASHFEAPDRPAAIAAADAALRHARVAVSRREDLADLQAMLANALISVMVLDPPRFQTLLPECIRVRLRALELGPQNPRVVIMDAGVLFNNPPERGGGQEKGIARWLEAIRLFETESRAPAVDPLMPTWGRTLAQGWLASMYLSMTPPQMEHARKAAEIALSMRPDFWYVRERILPRLPK